MAVRKESHSPLKPLWHLKPDLLRAMWEFIGERRQFEWNINGTKFLQLLINEEEFSYVMNIQDTAEQNIALRNIIKQYFHNQSLEHKQKLAYWIVKHWGKIVTTRSSINKMTADISIFEDENIDRFLKLNGTYRISSWSKFLSFSNPEKYTIYDSWNSIALNIVLLETNQISQFEMPGSRVSDHNKMKTHIHKFKKIKKDGYIWGYDEYQQFFKLSVEQNYIKNILEGEMTVFANAEYILNNFSEKHKLGLIFDRSKKNKRKSKKIHK